MKNSLSAKGLSMSQAQSVSNICNQRCKEIANAIRDINNASKTLHIEGKTYVSTKGNPMPGNIVDLLKEKSRLHATQAFLMENVKYKNERIKDLQSARFDFDVITPMPERSELLSFSEMQSVNETFGWAQLSIQEYNEYLEAEAYAAHIGQFIHKDGILDNLRNELSRIKTLEWMEIEDGKKTPIDVTVHHTPEQLLAIYEELAALHRQYEQRVNYFKAKVKNLTTAENARIAKLNAVGQDEVNSKNIVILENYSKDKSIWMAERTKRTHEFEEKRQLQIQEIAEQRINVDTRFQSVVDDILNKLS